MHCSEVLIWPGPLIDSFLPARNINIILGIFYILNTFIVYSLYYIFTIQSEIIILFQEWYIKF